MLFRKKRNALFKEVSDISSIVYDFRRRTNMLFENYRSVSYKNLLDYDLDKLKAKDLETVNELISNHALDAGNGDAMINTILEEVRSGIEYLDSQHLSHLDFYTRQSGNMGTHSMDLGNLIETFEVKEKELKSHHAETTELYTKYYKKGIECHENEKK